MDPTVAFILGAVFGVICVAAGVGFAQAAKEKNGN